MKLGLYLSLIITGFFSAIVFSIIKGFLFFEAYSGVIIFFGSSALAILFLIFSLGFWIALRVQKR
jgi:hypothetical protein